MTHVNNSLVGKPTFEEQTTISNGFLSLLLITSKKHLTPRLYQKALQEAGLEQFDQELPTGDTAPVSTFDKVAIFTARIYHSMPEGVYPLFSHNLGVSIAKGLIRSPLVKELKPKVEVIFKDERLSPESKIKQLVDFINTVPALRTAEYKAEGINILSESNNCIFCHNLTTLKPICHTRTVYLTQTFSELTGWHFLGEQYQALSCGNPACAYRLTPIGIPLTS